MEEELDDWFMILLGPWGREDQPDGDPGMADVPKEFLRRLRESASDWEAVGVDPDDTVGCYEDERLRVGVEIGDDDGAGPTAVLRIEFSDRDWQGAWADPTDGITAPTMIEARPRGEIVGGPITSSDGGGEISEALAWLRTQLQRPVERRSSPGHSS